MFSAATLLSHNAAVLFPVATNIFVLGLLVFQRTRKSGSPPAFQAPLWVALQLANVGLLAQEQGNQARALELFQESLRESWKLTYLWGTGWSMEKVARSVAAYGHSQHAVRLFAAAEALFQALETPLLPTERPGHETYLALARGGLDASNFEAAWAEGWALPLERAVAEALEETGKRAV